MQTKMCLPWGVYLTTNFTVPKNKRGKSCYFSDQYHDYLKHQTKINFSIKILNFNSVTYVPIVCIGVSTAPLPPPKKKHPLSFLPSPSPLKSEKCPSHPFLGNPPAFYIGFLWTLLPKSRIFQWTPKF